MLGGLVCGCAPRHWGWAGGALLPAPLFCPVLLPLFSAFHSRDINPNSWAAVAQEEGLFYTV